MHQFNVGDWVQLNLSTRSQISQSFSNQPEMLKIFLGPMQIVGILSASRDARFFYPPGSKHAGDPFHFNFRDLEPALPPTSGMSPDNKCRCALTLLMNRGCQCGNFKAEQMAKPHSPFN